MFLKMLIGVLFLFSCEKEESPYDIIINVGDTVTVNLDFIEGAGNTWDWVNRSDVELTLDTVNLKIISSGRDEGTGQYCWEFLAYKEADCYLKFNLSHFNDSIIEMKQYRVLIE